MIRRFNNFLNLGLRPSGKYELVDSTSGELTFLDSDPGGTDLDILINPDDIPFPSRPRSFLSALRDERAKLLETARRTRKNKPKGTTDGTTSNPTKRPRQSKKIPATLEQSLIGLQADVAELLRKSYRES